MLISNSKNSSNNNLCITTQSSWERLLLGKIKKQCVNEIGIEIVTKNCCVGNFWRL